ncbi:J domain-containing protein [Cesiribacter andamanensis]|uniref:Chaperone protein DnaJ n=1 Tax=Cesiribacter andamanensis AMV16 TaxID=1279009 RepID=M7NGV0_9BACT|nr:J domain-containing protein [Cesiribacter andamanensis]EMR01060.1 Chaperone protein DnaJ [Cesiribacter andamanensis AMV16]
MKNYYSILQLAPAATQPEIKKAYRMLVKKHHPDVATTAAGGISIQEINEAYRVLSNPQKRQAYDWAYFASGDEEQAPAIHYAPAGERPSRRQPRERERIAPYMRYVYPILQTSLAFCLLLLVDYALPLRKRSTRPSTSLKCMQKNTAPKQPGVHAATWTIPSCTPFRAG